MKDWTSDVIGMAILTWRVSGMVTKKVVSFDKIARKVKRLAVVQRSKTVRGITAVKHRNVAYRLSSPFFRPSSNGSSNNESMESFHQRKGEEGKLGQKTGAKRRKEVGLEEIMRWYAELEQWWPCRRRLRRKLLKQQEVARVVGVIIISTANEPFRRAPDYRTYHVMIKAGEYEASACCRKSRLSVRLEVLTKTTMFNS